MWFGRNAKRAKTRHSTRRRGAIGARRALRVESFETRLLLTVAPEVNTSEIARFDGLKENAPITSNNGESVSNLLASGGPIMTDPANLPLGFDFAFFDEKDGAQEGIAVTGLTGTNDGTWEYSTNNGSSWSLLAANTSPTSALLLSGSASNDDVVRYLPDNGFSGQVTMQIRAWDQSDGAAIGSTVNLDSVGGDGAFSSGSTSAALMVATSVPPSFTLKQPAANVLENNNGGNSGPQTATFVVTDVSPGNGGSGTVTYSFTSSPTGEVLNPVIDANGTLTFNLAQNVYGTVTLNVTAKSGSLSSQPQSTQINIEQTTPPSFSPVNEQVVENSGAASFSGWAQNISYGQNGSGGSLTYSITSDNDPSLFSSAPAFTGGGNTLAFTPATGQIGQATLTAVVYNSLTRLTSAPVQFTIGVYGAPSTTPNTYVVGNSGSSYVATSGGVLSHDGDPNSSFDGGLTAQLVAGPAYGAVSLNPGGDFTYSPGGSFQGYDQFTYKAVSGAAGATQTVTVYSHGGALVAKMYQQMLNRAALATDVEGWAPSVDGNLANIAAVDKGIYQSNEYESPQIANFYQKFLFRSPGSSETSYYESVWTSNNDQGPPPIIVDIASSTECFDDEGQNDTNWVTLLYTAILNRAPDSGGLNYFVNQLETGTSRAAVVGEFVNGGEYHGDVVESFYQTFLGRSASQSDLSYYENLMANGDNQLQIQQIIVGSPEYTGNPPAAASGAADLWTW